MTIKDYFAKPVGRSIETVIKADDRDNISTELTEYVITNEIAKKIRDLFQAYNNYAGVNGVWISGFFGSGKSHLLKILSYVLVNKESDGYKSGEFFAEKIEDDEMLKADVLATTRIPSEAILFNIDQQAQITSKADENAILSVFYKVFFDHLGYYGFQPHVAEFEMWLDKQGEYADFKSKFNEKHGQPWEEVRVDYFDPVVTDTVAEVLGEMFEMDASKYEDILDEMEDKQKQSIEDFSNRVNEYIKTKASGFRLNFFVDEVGQYISDNTKLMLNLQTIAESLATKTKGKSWILVTSQEDMEKVIGDMTKAQENDFSRIQARFKIKIPLTSANVDEVIEKRLLKKTEPAQQQLISLYRKEHAHLDTLISFSEAGVQFKGYQGEVDFANKYPFAPYQFDLFQQCRRALSTHNAFQGKHSSVGERSMLGVFQQVIQEIEDKDDRTLVSFDKMYSGIKNELRGEVQSSIALAKKQLDSPFAVQVLKALFLVKYFGNFKTTKRNISVLMLDNMEVDLKKHEQDIEGALNKLENQIYIQRNGELYEFLTDDEKDVEEAIKYTQIDEQKKTELLVNILFDEIVGDKKIKFLDNKQDYQFSRKIDGVTIGKDGELEIEIITQNYLEYTNTAFIQAQTMGSTGVKFVLPPDSNFIKDVEIYLKTEKFYKQKNSVTNRKEVTRILQEKITFNTQRKKDLVFLGNKLLSEATVYLNGSKHEMGATSDGKTRVVKAFQDLVKNVYSNLRMLGNIQFTEDTIKSVIRNAQDDLFGTDDATISEAESQIFNFVARRKNRADRTSLQEVKNEFSSKPYGWYPNAVWTIIAKLYKRGKLELKEGSNSLEDQEVINALINSSYHSSILLDLQEEIDPKQVKELKRAYSDAFDETCAYNDPKEVAKSFKDKLNGMLVEVSQLLVRKSEYPFLDSLEPFSEELKQWCRKENSWYVHHISEFEDELLDVKEDLLDPIRRFMNGEQAKIYDGVKQLLQGNTANLDYIQSDELDLLKAVIESKTPYKGNSVQLAKAAKDELATKVLALIENEKEQALKFAEKQIENIKERKEFSKLDSPEKQKILSSLEKCKTIIQKERFIANIRQSSTQLAEMHTAALNLMQSFLRKPHTEGKAAEPETKYIQKANVHIPYDKTELQTEADVLEYVEALKEVYINRVKEHIRITL